MASNAAVYERDIENYNVATGPELGAIVDRVCADRDHPLHGAWATVYRNALQLLIPRKSASRAAHEAAVRMSMCVPGVLRAAGLSPQPPSTNNATDVHTLALDALATFVTLAAGAEERMDHAALLERDSCWQMRVLISRHTDVLKCAFAATVMPIALTRMPEEYASWSVDRHCAVHRLLSAIDGKERLLRDALTPVLAGLSDHMVRGALGETWATGRPTPRQQSVYVNVLLLWYPEEAQRIQERARGY